MALPGGFTRGFELVPDGRTDYLHRGPERAGPGASTGTVRSVCGRYTSQSPPDVIADYFHVDEVVAPELGVRFNVAPSQDVYAVAQRHGVRRLGSLRWGLVPFWADDPKIGNRMINARAETLATSS